MIIIEAMQITGKIMAVANLAWTAWAICCDWRRHRFDADYIWFAGIAIFAVVIQWSSALLLWLAYGVWCICVIAGIVSIILQFWSRKRRIAELDAERQRIIDEIGQSWQPSITVRERENIDDDH